MKKKVLCLVFAAISFLLVSAIYAEEDSQSVLINPPVAAATTAPAPSSSVMVHTGNALVVVPLWTKYRMYNVVPVQPTPIFMAPPIKPLFSTPFRDSWFYGKYNHNVKKYNKYSKRLNVPIIVPAAPQNQ
jgi:hypothetical protein